MKKSKHETRSALRKENNQCLSCGTLQISGRRRYCSKDCRQQLFRRLHILAGLLRALGTKYATFSFTDFFLVLDIKPQGSKNVYRFVHQRSLKQKPSQALFYMTDELGNVWWDNKKKTGKRYQASQQVFNRATKKNIDSDLVIPIEIKSPTRMNKFLASLNLTKHDLESNGAKKTIKSAYRKKALKYHPDRGGDAASFRKINSAYQALINWLKSPDLRIRRGIPGKWCFDGKKWTSPLPFFSHGKI